MIKVDDEEIHILNTPGHWKACLCVYLPSSKVLFAGDTIFGPNIDSLEKLSKLDIRCIIPGHGRLCDTKEISRHITYFEELITKA